MYIELTKLAGFNQFLELTQKIRIRFSMNAHG